jgi:thiol:disulfide interchange protein
LFAWSARVDATPGDEGPGESRTSKAAASNAPAKAIWRASYADVLAEADKQDKPVLLRFTAAWCMPCRVMDAKVWPDAKVKAAIAKHVIPVEIDVDEEANMDVTRRYGVNAIPTLLLVDATGDELARGNFMGVDQLVKFVQSQ